MVKEMIKVNNTYDKLQEVVLGNLDKNILSLVPEEHYNKLEFIFDQTIDDLNTIQKIFESTGITVHRPKFWDCTQTLQTPFYSTPGHRVPLTPRDYFLVLGDTLIETTSWSNESAFTGFYYRDLFVDCFKKGAGWLNMPMATHNPEYIDEIDDVIPNREPMIDAPNLTLYNDTIFVSDHGSNNQLGIDWIKRHFPNYNYIHLDKKHFIGHLDAHFNIVGPGKILTWHPREHFPDYFKNWTFIQLDKSYDAMKSGVQQLLDGRVQDDDFANTILSANSLVIDQNTLMMSVEYKDADLGMIKEIENHGIDIAWAPYRYQHFFNHGITCITLELVRDNG